MADEQEANLGGSGDRQQRFARVMARQSRRDALGTLKKKACGPNSLWKEDIDALPSIDAS